MNLRLLLPVLRPVIATILVWAAGRGSVELTEDQIAQTTEQVTVAVVNVGALMIGLYGVLANVLKWPFYKKLGELQPGDVAPPTHEREAAKAEAARAKPVEPTTVELIRASRESEEGEGDM
jgi:hypothetical protein